MSSYTSQCGTCATPVYPPVTCSGPCGRPFHPLCANLATDHLHALAANVGLHWMCGQCRSDGPADQVPALRKSIQDLGGRIDSIDENLRDIKALLAARLPLNGPSREVSERAAENEPLKQEAEDPQLPVELWEEIFQYLSKDQLLQIRQTCHRWKNIVDGCSKLVDKCTVEFLPYRYMDEHFDPTPLFPASRACFNDYGNIQNVDLWWPGFGRRLTFLNFKGAEVALSTVLNILKFTPNLRELNFGYFCRPFVTGDFDAKLSKNINFKLYRMEKLSFELDLPENVLKGLGKILPNLKCLDISENYDAAKDRKALFRFINRVKGSLEVLCCNENLSPNGWKKIFQIPNLRLKEVDITDSKLLAGLCKTHKSLERFRDRIQGTNADFLKLVKYTKKLKKIAVTIEPDEGATSPLVPSFLESMTVLEDLDIYVKDNPFSIDLDDVKNPNLKKIQFTGLLPVCGMQNYLSKSPRLTSLDLSRCTFDSWPELFTSLQSLKLLESVKIMKVEVNYAVDYFNNSSIALKYLTIIDCEIERMLDTIIFLCPKLCDLTLMESGDFKISRVPQELRRLDFRQDKLSNCSTSSIIKHCRHIKHLTVASYNSSTECMKRLQDEFGSRFKDRASV